MKSFLRKINNTKGSSLDGSVQGDSAEEDEFHDSAEVNVDEYITIYFVIEGVGPISTLRIIKATFLQSNGLLPLPVPASESMCLESRFHLAS